jgi:hypothetical protein
MTSAEDDAWLESEIDAAVAPFKGLVSAAELAFMKEELRSSAREGATARLARAARPRAIDASGAVTYQHAEPASSEAATEPIVPPKDRAGSGG